MSSANKLTRLGGRSQRIALPPSDARRSTPEEETDTGLVKATVNDAMAKINERIDRIDEAVKSQGAKVNEAEELVITHGNKVFELENDVDNTNNFALKSEKKTETH
ncbi:hypothetical protein ACHAPT_006270 [Fusarium lateritium]